MNFWQTFFGVSKGQVCTFACTSIIDFRAFRMPGKTILQHNINQLGPLPGHPKRDIILPCTENGDCISFDWSMRQTQTEKMTPDDWYSSGVALFFAKKSPHSAVL